MPLLPHFLQSHAIASAADACDGAVGWQGWHRGRQRYVTLGAWRARVLQWMAGRRLRWLERPEGF